LIFEDMLEIFQTMLEGRPTLYRILKDVLFLVCVGESGREMNIPLANWH